MWLFITKRILYAIPIIISVNLITFILFFVVNSPDSIARTQLGDKHITQEDIDTWKENRGYNLPTFYNSNAQGFEKFSQTIFFQKSIPLIFFDFGFSDSGRKISQDIKQRMWPSLAIAIPAFILSIITNIIISLILVSYRYTKVETFGMTLMVVLISISGLFYIMFSQLLFSGIWHYFPVSGYESGLNSWRFVLLPVIISVIGGLGGGVRLYHSFFMDIINQDYIKFARAKGLSERLIMFKHVLKNAMIPILTGIVVVLPSLFMGSLILESFFAIPGLGSYTIDALFSQDFATVRSMVYLGSILYIIGLIMTDISYVLVDPRVKL